MSSTGFFRGVASLAVISATLAIALSQTTKPRFFKAVRSPDVAVDGRITFRFFAPNAKQVTLLMDGFPKQELTKDNRGAWSATTEPMAPDYYEYSFVVDGVQIADPANNLH